MKFNKALKYFLVLILFSSSLPSFAESTRVITRTGVAQIRLERSDLVIDAIEPNEAAVTNQPAEDDNPVTVVNENAPELDQLQLIINAIPAAQFHGQDRLGIYYDPHQPITLANPVRIYNIKTGGYFSAYFDDESFLRFTVGTAPNSINGISRLPQAQRIELSSLDFHDSAVLETVYNEANLDAYKIGSVEQVTMDILPRFRKRYGTVGRTTLINGIYIPKGSIVVGTRDSAVARPSLSDMNNLRFYSPEGVLLNVVPEQDKNKLDCGTVSKAQCFDFDSHYTPQATTEFGAKAYATYNTKDFFPGKTARQANQIWIEIQKDLEADTVLNINAGKEAWHQRILQDLNQQEAVYLFNLFDNQSDIDVLKDLFGYKPTVGFDGFKFKQSSMVDVFQAYCDGSNFSLSDEDDREEALDKAYDSMFCKLKSFTDAKLDKWEARDDWENSDRKKSGQLWKDYNDAQKEQIKQRDSYIDMREIYNHELKYGAINRKPKEGQADEGASIQANNGDVTDPGIPAECQKKKERSKKKCRQYYEAPPRCINKNGYLKKNDQSCHGYKSPGFAPEQPSVIKAPRPQPIISTPVSKPPNSSPQAPAQPSKPSPAPKKKKQNALQKARNALRRLLQ